MNCNDTSGDKPDNVQENKRRALEYLNLPIESMITVTMVHGHEVAIVDKSWDVTQKTQLIPIILLNQINIGESDKSLVMSRGSEGFCLL
ncbi:laccase domain-containing protein [Legionella sp. EUR-108]|uniref:Laccase domain-containing protein n=1 Tax=Legionella maioricensis TaxID=2896528 RepID=A0A9X2D436_9GAMM|nr:laccase domain-containing protein [Legionella maioricensis]MCL9689098.1 laccase domain-containing protein [Legionella maioricensis]